MNVKEMIELMGTLGVGEGANVVPEDVYIQYLNLANLELYQQTASFNDDILTKETRQNIVGPNIIELNNYPYIINSVIVVGQRDPLFKMPFVRFSMIVDEAQNNPNNQNAQTPPSIYTKQNKKITFFPFNEDTVYTVNVFYAKQPKKLNIDTEEEDVPYPIAYHNVLVDGALKYLFAGEGGFRSSKNQERAVNDYAVGKSRLISYLQGSNSHRISTFRSA